ncbi:hypothetical protein [Paenibacillus nanensis]|uniref:hypothetical protein n=1 Tax=Paenibacillus nanensis TaxID=393251 RepID=UPI0013C2FB0E|nr:hypothetical protein [Paenibacillus nanensis]
MERKEQTALLARKPWVKPELETLSIRDTEYWQFVYNPETGFWQSVWVNES